MIPDPPDQASTGAPARSGDIDCWAAIGTSDSPPRQNSQGKKRGGRAPKAKGSRLERAVVRLLQDHGLDAERIPLSGSAGGSFSGDISVPVCNRDLILEVKSRARGFSQIYAWLEGRDALILKVDRRPPIVVLPLRLAAEIALAAERRKP